MDPETQTEVLKLKTLLAIAAELLETILRQGLDPALRDTYLNVVYELREAAYPQHAGHP